MDLLARTALRDLKAIRAIKAIADCKALKAIALLAPRASQALADLTGPLVLLAPKGRKVIAEGTARLARLALWVLADFKACAAIRGPKESKALAACKALRENRGRLGLKELWDCAVTLAHRGHKAKFPRAL